MYMLVYLCEKTRFCVFIHGNICQCTNVQTYKPTCQRILKFGFVMYNGVQVTDITWEKCILNFPLEVVFKFSHKCVDSPRNSKADFLLCRVPCVVCVPWR